MNLKKFDFVEKMKFIPIIKKYRLYKVLKCKFIINQHFLKYIFSNITGYTYI